MYRKELLSPRGPSSIRHFTQIWGAKLTVSSKTQSCPAFWRDAVPFEGNNMGKFNVSKVSLGLLSSTQGRSVTMLKALIIFRRPIEPRMSMSIAFMREWRNACFLVSAN